MKNEKQIINEIYKLIRINCVGKTYLEKYKKKINFLAQAFMIYNYFNYNNLIVCMYNVK